MTPATLIDHLAATTGASKVLVRTLLQALAAQVGTTLAQDQAITVPGIGKFKPVAKAARPGRSPRTGEAIVIPAKRSLKLVAAKLLKDRVAGVE